MFHRFFELFSAILNRGKPPATDQFGKRLNIYYFCLEFKLIHWTFMQWLMENRFILTQYDI